MKRKTLILLVLACLFLLNIPLVVGVSSLYLVVSTDKQIYQQGEDVRIAGTLSLGVNPITEWPVAVSVNAPNGSLLIMTTLETDQTGNFAKTFNLPVEAEPGSYTVLSSVQWANQYAVRETSFEIKSDSQPEDSEPHVLDLPLSIPPVPLTLIAAGLASGLIMFALSFYAILAFRRKVEARTSPVTSKAPVSKIRIPVVSQDSVPPVKPIGTPVTLAATITPARMPKDAEAPATSMTRIKRMDTKRHKTCSKCRSTFLGFRTFCPYCFTYYGNDS